MTAVALLFCLTCFSCGGQSPAGPTVPTPPDPIPPGPVSPPAPTPTPSIPQIFVGAGDIGVCGGSSGATAKLLETIGGQVFTLGDNAYYSGTRQEFRDCYDPTWGRLKSRTRPVPGNHEYESVGAAPYFEYFGASAGPSGLGYYSFELGDFWHAIALNSNIPVDSGSAQAQWLLGDLAASRARCTVAYWHHPLFSSGPHGDQVQMRDVWRVLYSFGADIVLAGHEHLYERFAPQDPDGRADPERGIRQFVAGTGGAPLFQFVRVRSNSEARISTFGVLKLTLNADAYQWEFVPASGPGDAGSGVCH